MNRTSESSKFPTVMCPIAPLAKSPCGAERRWQDSGAEGMDPVDRLCMTEGDGSVSTPGKSPDGRDRSSFRLARRMVESARRDDRDSEAQPGRSSMAEQAPSPQPRIL